MASTSPKRSIFSKPSWATSSAPTTKSEDSEVFGRSQVYEDIVAENRKKKEKRVAKARVREGSEVRHAKRRRVSKDHEDESDSDSADSTNAGGKMNPKEIIEEKRSISRSTPIKQKLVPALGSPIKIIVAKQQKDEAPPIFLDDEEDDIQITAISATAMPLLNGKSKQSSDEDSDDDPDSEGDDDYTRGLKRKAREKRQADKLALFQKQTSQRVPSVDPNTSLNVNSPELAHESPSVPETKDEGPIVQIYITSIYPNTKALIVKEAASRQLKRVKEIWCMRQGLDARVDQFFLTWNMAKLFDSSNLLSALEALKRKRPDEQDPSDGKIHLEMMTAEIFEHRQRQNAREEAEAIAPTEQQLSMEPELPPPEPKFMVNLRAKDLEEMHLLVRPSTQIEKVMKGYRKQMEIEHDRTFSLVFDGDRLEPDVTVGAAGIEDGDVVEVVFK